jgi:hypothetical protein
MTDELVRRFKATGPKFVFGPRKVALIASIADVGAKLAQNQAAHDLVAALIAETSRRDLGDFPTVMMLRTVLELNGIPIKFVPLEKLGLSVEPGRN